MVSGSSDGAAAVGLTTFECEVVVSASADEVWARVVTPEGINNEMRPWMTMSIPLGAGELSIDTIRVGEPLGRAWLRLFGVIPFDYDALTIVELDPGRRFYEQSTMMSMRRWEHERTLFALGEHTRVRDRISFEPRLPIPGIAPLLRRILQAFFGHRHRKLHAHFERVVE